MKILYLGVSDYYLPATAAAVHLGRLDKAFLPAREKLKSIPFFRALGREDDGRLHFLGQDDSSNYVYLASVKEHPEIFSRAVESLLGIYRIPFSEFTVVPCVPENPQISSVCSLLAAVGLSRAADWVGTRVVRNRFQDLILPAGQKPAPAK